MFRFESLIVVRKPSSLLVAVAKSGNLFQPNPFYRKVVSLFGRG